MKVGLSGVGFVSVLLGACMLLGGCTRTGSVANIWENYNKACSLSRPAQHAPAGST